MRAEEQRMFGVTALLYDVFRRCQIFPTESKKMTNLGAVLTQLKEERDRLDRAIAALSDVGRGRTGRGGKRRYRRRRAKGSQRRNGHVGLR